jgi:hypothetical protein
LNTDASSRKDHLAAEVVSRWVEFQTALSDKRKYPLQQFQSFADVTRRYVRATRGDALIHLRIPTMSIRYSDLMSITIPT